MLESPLVASPFPKQQRLQPASIPICHQLSPLQQRQKTETANAVAQQIKLEQKLALANLAIKTLQGELEIEKAKAQNVKSHQVQIDNLQSGNLRLTEEINRISKAAANQNTFKKQPQLTVLRRRKNKKFKNGCWKAP